MAVAFRASAVGGDVDTPTDLTISKPTGVVDGDVMIAVITADSASGSITPPAGWTALNTGTVNAANRGWTYWKKAASEGASYAFATSGAGITWKGAILAYSGADGTTPINANATGTDDDGNTTLTSPSVTTTVDGCMIVAIYTNRGGSGVFPASPDASPAATERIESETGGSSDFRIYAQDYLQPTAVAVSLDATLTATQGFTTFTVAIAPAAGGGGGPSNPFASATIRMMNYIAVR